LLYPRAKTEIVQKDGLSTRDCRYRVYDGGVFTEVRGDIELFYARDADALGMLSEGDARLAFIGSDKLSELGLGGVVTEVSAMDSIPMRCRLALMGTRAAVRDIPTQLGTGELLTVATSYPLTLERFAQEEQLNLVVTKVPTGGVEAYARTGRTDLAFDIVSSGATQRDNDLLIYREGDPLSLKVIDGVSYQPDQSSSDLETDLLKVAMTYFQRIRQARRSTESEDSYTVRLLRDPNLLTKKLGEEFAEFMQAALRQTPSKRELRSEGADLLYVMGLCLARSGVTIEEVVSEDIRRNKNEL
jgi:phosphoribosyl-ATP pyrophosphohydrolase